MKIRVGMSRCPGKVELFLDERVPCLQRYGTFDYRPRNLYGILLLSDTSRQRLRRNESRSVQNLIAADLGCFTLIEIQGAVQPGTRLDDRGGAVVVEGNDIFGQKLATDALMVAFGVVMGDAFTNKMSQVGFAKNDELVEALIPD